MRRPSQSPNPLVGTGEIVDFPCDLGPSLGNPSQGRAFDLYSEPLVGAVPVRPSLPGGPISGIEECS